MKNIKKLRIERNITRKTMAEKVGISETYICYLENGKRNNPSAQIAIKISKMLDVSPQELFLD
ncbi:MAG: helix-turn-helix transcriptional regulator [Clostridiaceae bacterium]